MFTTTATAPFDGSDGRSLTPDQVWRGLQIRARNGDERFAPPGHRFEVISDDGETVMRTAHLADGTVEVQRITSHGSRVQVFEFVEGPQKSVILCSIETDADARFVLRLTFLTSFPGLEHGSAEEAAFAAKRRPLMTGQPAHVLQVIRSLVDEGVLT